MGIDTSAGFVVQKDGVKLYPGIAAIAPEGLCKRGKAPGLVIAAVPTREQMCAHRAHVARIADVEIDQSLLSVGDPPLGLGTAWQKRALGRSQKEAVGAPSLMPGQDLGGAIDMAGKRVAAPVWQCGPPTCTPPGPAEVSMGQSHVYHDRNKAHS